MSLKLYQKKRRFKETPEPRGVVKKSAGKALEFVIQEHHASHLHWDFRLEMEGVMKSWAVPKGPSLDPAVKRLAMHVEDHPMSYNKFEGIIPEGNYGAGVVKIWDKGVYAPIGGNFSGYKKGDYKFVMYGKKLKGGFALVKMKGPKNTGKEWLLIKERDEYAKKTKKVK